MKMKVLVTGGAGFIGSNIIDRLIKEDFEVVVVDNLSSGKVHNINKKAKLYKLDIQDPALESVFQIEKPDYVNHHAAQKDVRLSVSDSIFDAKINVLGTLNIFQNCIQHQVKKLIFASTGGANYGEQDVFPASETHPVRPISPYGITKLVAEHYLFYYKTIYGVDYVSLRYSNVYGSRQDPYGEAGVITIFIEKMIKGEQPVINGDDQKTRDFVYVEDVARANMVAMTSKTSDCIFNIGTGIEISINQLVSHLKGIINLFTEEKHGPAKQGEQKRSVIDYNKARNILHWKPEVTFIDGMKKTCYSSQKKINMAQY
jgi:UDP-glucose 4-epimerase